MGSDRQRAWLWALGVCIGVAVYVAGTWCLATGDQTWRAVVRVKIDQSPADSTNRAFSPFLLQDQIQSASNTFSDSVFRRELEANSGTSVDGFRLLYGRQYRGTAIIELKFVGPTEAEVKTLAEKAVQLWRERLATNAPAFTSEFFETYTLTSARDQWYSVRQWRWRHLGF